MENPDYRGFDALTQWRKFELMNPTLTGRMWENWSSAYEDFRADGLGPRAARILAINGFDEIDEAQFFFEEDFLRLPEFGKTSLMQLKSVLALKGLSLRPKSARREPA